MHTCDINIAYSNDCWPIRAVLIHTDKDCILTPMSAYICHYAKDDHKTPSVPINQDNNVRTI